MNKQYLGDSVYADFDGFGITLTTENGFGPSNTIYLEPQVLALLELIRRICARRSRRRQNRNERTYPSPAIFTGFSSRADGGATMRFATNELT